MKKKRTIVSILVVGLLLNMAPAIIGDPTTDAADEPDRLEESIDEVSLIDADALFKLIDFEKLDARMDSALYAEDDVVMIVDVAPDQQESIGVEQMTIKKNGEVQLKHIKPLPVGFFARPAYNRRVNIYGIPGSIIIRTFAIFYHYPSGAWNIRGASVYTRTWLGVVNSMVVHDFEKEEIIGENWAIFWGYAYCEWSGHNNKFDLWAGVQCYNNGLLARPHPEGECWYPAN